MQTDDLIKQVAFIKEIDKLKYIQRKTKLFNSDRHENDAEHSWTSLSIPKGNSQTYNDDKFSKPKEKGHFTDEFLNDTKE